MTSEPVKFPKEVKTERAPTKEIVDICERLLAQAKSGELTALAYASVRGSDLQPDSAESSGWHAIRNTRFAMTYSLRHLLWSWETEAFKD